MNSPPPLPNEQKMIERIAVEVMGWTEDERIKAFARNVKHPADPYWYGGTHLSMKVRDSWNPLTDWNAWRQVEEKMLENETLFCRYISTLYENKLTTDTYRYEQWVARADLPTRCQALLSALDSLSPNNHGKEA